jgi:hypothetical protein
VHSPVQCQIGLVLGLEVTPGIRAVVVPFRLVRDHVDVERCLVREAFLKTKQVGANVGF